MEYPLSLICANFGFADGITIIAIALLLVCSAFFSASETAFSTANALRIKNYADEKVKGAIDFCAETHKKEERKENDI